MKKEEAMKGRPSLAEVAAVEKDATRASQEMLASKTEEKRYSEELTNLLSYPVREIKSVSRAIQKPEAIMQMEKWMLIEIVVTPASVEPSVHPTKILYGSFGPTELRPVQRSWVPPQLPPVAIAEAAAAIQQPKRLMFHKGN